MDKEDLKKAYRSEKDLKIRARILAVHMVSVCEESIDKTATNPMQSERWVRDWLKRYGEGGLNGFRDLLRLGLERRTGATGSGRRIEGMRCDVQRHGCPTWRICTARSRLLVPCQFRVACLDKGTLQFVYVMKNLEQCKLGRGRGLK